MGIKAGPTSSAGGGGGGQSNTIAALGGGLVLTATVTKVGVQLQVRSIAATSPLNVAQVADLITITIDALVNADIDGAAAIAYSKLNLTGLIVNADINASAAIAYSKLNLTGLIVNADINASAAIALTKLVVTPKFVMGGRRTAASANDVQFISVFTSAALASEANSNEEIAFGFRIFQHSFVVITNTKDGASIVGLRDDGVNVADLSIAAATTGTADTGTITVDVASGSLINYFWDTTASTTGSFQPIYLTNCEQIA